MEDTATVGAEPTWIEFLLKPLINERGEVGDKSDPPPDKGDDKSDPPPDKGDDESDPPPGEKVPWDKDPRWKEWRDKEKKLEGIFESNKVESIDELVDLVNEGHELKGKIKDIGDIEELIKAKQTLDQYEEYWSQEDEHKRREDEQPDVTIKRLEDELADTKRKEAEKAEQQEATKQAQKAVNTYERKVKVLLDEANIDKDEMNFVQELFGIDNPLNDVNIEDSKAVSKMIKDGLKKKEDYDQLVIRKYLAGKIEIPKIPAGDASVSQDKEVKTLKEARSTFRELMKKTKFGGEGV